MLVVITPIPQAYGMSVYEHSELAENIRSNLYLHGDSGGRKIEREKEKGHGAAAIAKLIQPSHHLCWLYDDFEEILEFTVQYCLDALAQNYIAVCHFVDKEIQEKYHKGEIILSCNPTHKFLSPNEVQL